MILIPARNEAENIASIAIDAAAHGDVVVVVNPSSDDTAGEAKKAGAHVIANAQDLNVGGSLLVGYAFALEHDYDAVVQMDAGGSHRPDDVPKFLDARCGNVTIGSRFAPGASFEQTFGRKLLSRAGRIGGNVASGVWNPCSDWTSGFRCYGRDALSFLVHAGITERGHAFNWMAAVRLAQAGFFPSFVPVSYRATTSSASFKSVWEAAWAFMVAIHG